MCKFMQEFFSNFVHKFKYEIRMNSYDFLHGKLVVTNGLYGTSQIGLKLGWSDIKYI